MRTKKLVSELKVNDHIVTIGYGRKINGKITEILPLHKKTRNQIGIRVFNEITGLTTYFDKFSDTFVTVLI